MCISNIRTVHGSASHTLTSSWLCSVITSSLEPTTDSICDMEDHKQAVEIDRTYHSHSTTCCKADLPANFATTDKSSSMEELSHHKGDVSWRDLFDTCGKNVDSHVDVGEKKEYEVRASCFTATSPTISLKC